MAGPQTGFVHDPQAVGEAAVLGRGEDPARALELADAPHSLQPGRVEEIALRRLFLRQTQPASPVGREPLGQLDVAVDRVADQVQGPQLRMRAATGWRRIVRAPHRTESLVLHRPSLADAPPVRALMAPEVSGSCPWSSSSCPSADREPRAATPRRPCRSAAWWTARSPPCRR